MRGRSDTLRSQSQGDGLLYVAVAVLLVAPLLSVMALLVLAGPSTRAALAGEDHARLDAAPGQPPASANEPSDGRAPRPLADVEAGGASGAAGDLAPIFEPRIGRFRLGETEPPNGGHAREALDQGIPGDVLLAGRDGDEP
ncbi:MAG: hypothetical protein M3O34_08465 [Chloroflexota bacterium]|nr:hypothetical protein [Chloroflexota bacterium]